VTKYIAFLRAINVGGHTVKMDALRGLFADLGLANVETFIASGNVIFEAAGDTPTIEKRIEAHLLESLGYAVATFVRSTAELAEVARYKAFADAEMNAETHGLYIGFLAESPTQEATWKLLACVTPLDEFHIHGREVYWLCRTRFSESTFSGPRLEKTLGMQTTIRNVTTLQKLVAKYT
jgi:uncharacterized protein (DUF1697 family)